LCNEAVQACPVSLRYRLQKFARRNKAALATITLIFSVLLLGLVGTSWQATVAIAARRDAVDFGKQALAAAESAKDAKQKAEQRGRELATLLYSADIFKAMVSWERFDPRVTRELLYRHRNELGNRQMLGFEWYYLWGLLQSFERDRAFTEEQWTISLAFSADGKYLAASHPLGATVSVWDVEKRALVGRYGQTGNDDWRRPPVAFSPQQGSAWLAFPGTDSSQLTLWEINTGEKRTLTGHTAEIRGIAFSPSGDVVVTASADGTARLWDVRTGGEIAVLGRHPQAVNCAAFSHNGKFLAIGEGDRTIRLWDAQSFAEIGALEGHTAAVLSVAFSSDDRVIASGSCDHTLRVWDVESRACLKTFSSHQDEVRKVVFTQGDILVSASRDRSLRMWDVRDWRELDTIGGYGGSFALACSPDGKKLAYLSQDYSIMLRDQQMPRSPAPMKCDGAVLQLAWLPDSKTLWARADVGQQLTAWRLRNGTVESVSPIVVDSKIGSFAVSPQGQLAIGLQDRPIVQVWDPQSRVRTDTLELAGFGGVRAIAFSVDGQRIGVGGHMGEVAVYDVQSHAMVFSGVRHAQMIDCVAFSPDGQMLATGSHDRHVRLWKVKSGELIRDFGERADIVQSLAFSMDGDTLAVALFSKDIELWDVTGRRDHEHLQGHSLYPSNLVFVRDGTLFSSGADGSVRLWDPSLLVERLALRGGESSYESIAVSPNGQTVAAGGRDGRVEVWHAASESEVQESGWDARPHSP
jgi:WD40 repeat protein